MKKAFLIVALAIVAPNLVYAQSMEAVVYSTDHEARVSYGLAALPYERDCTVILKNETGGTVATVTSTEGGHKRLAVFTGLIAASTYRLNISCGLPFGVINDDSFVTVPELGTTATPVRFNAGGHPTIIDGDRARVQWGSTPAMTEAPVQNTSCVSGCNIDVASVTPGVWYREWEWQDIANTVVGKSGTDAFIIGGSRKKTLTSSVNGEEPAIPSLALWEQYMTQYGAAMCGPTGKYRTLSLEAGVYYDAQWVMEEIASYVEAKGGDPTFWRNCIHDATDVSRDGYVIPNFGGVKGYNNFTKGMLKSAIRTNNADPNDRKAVLWQAGWHIEDLLGVGAAYCGQVWTNANPTWIREHAYCFRNVINAKHPIFNINPDAGPGAANKTETLYQRVVDDIKTWVGDPDEALTYQYDPVNGSKGVCDFEYYNDSLYIILASNALIQYDEQLGDPGNHHAEILELVKHSVDFLWTYMKHPGFPRIAFEQCWETVDVGGPTSPGLLPNTSIAADLNALYADTWAWVYQQTCDPVYRQQADDIFSFGVRDMPRYITNSGKHFNQSFSTSFDYVRRRQQDVCP